ncbi:hypothetical protein GCM10023347_07470 [Streptomyces chumphonensis]
MALSGGAPFRQPSIRRLKGLSDHRPDAASLHVAGSPVITNSRDVGASVDKRMWNGLVGVAQETCTASLGEGACRAR